MRKNSHVKYLLFYDPLSITAHTVIKYTSSTEISTNFKSTSISITANFVCPTVPDYEESVQILIFATSDKFEEWFKKDASPHAKRVFKRQYPVTSNPQFIGKPIPEVLSAQITFYLCDHASTDKKKAKNSTGTIDVTSVVSSVDYDQGSRSNELGIMRHKKTRITMKSSIKIGCIGLITWL
ncbi:hypothetical protein RMCBS344292_19399 [Rhizopus microsporus]|nr:hypothetical protein RMCBS344292_19399 [Rhizopus microsporus]